MNNKKHSCFITIICVLISLAAAFLVRLPAFRLDSLPETQRAAYIYEEESLPYLSDPDSYYHIRLVDNYLKYGSLGNAVQDDGTPWDTLSFYPKGRHAVYQPGIVYLTTAIWRAANAVAGVSLYAVEYWLAVFMSILTALAAFILGKRMGGNAAGLIAGIFVACASSFVARSVPGRYDTDMFVVLMDVLMILLISEAMRARSLPGRIILSAGFAVAVLVYSVCWSVFAFMFAAITMLGALIFTVLLLFAPKAPGETRSRLRLFFSRNELQTLILSIGLTILFVVLVNGVSFLKDFASTLTSVNSLSASAVLPNLFGSVSELRTPSFFPSEFPQWFLPYIPGSTMTVLTGIGGLIPAVLCVLAIMFLAAGILKMRNENSRAITELPRKCNVLYLVILLLWLAGCLYAVRLGVRFTEHLAVPVGILGGASAGWIISHVKGVDTLPSALRPVLVVLICACAVILPLIGSVMIGRAVRPSASDAHENAMLWIRDNAGDDEAVAASWWDMGYFYVAASAHPVYWDGGSQTGIRAILISKALTAQDPELTKGILAMLSGSGDAAADYLIGKMDAEKVFDTLWKVIPEDHSIVVDYLTGSCGLTLQEAEEADQLIHPSDPEETYLVLTDTMMSEIGWFEYYSGWDFTGTQPAPSATVYYSTTDGTGRLGDTDEATRRFFENRAKETVWRLYFEHECGDSFSLAFEENDGVSNVQVWKVEF